MNLFYELAKYLLDFNQTIQKNIQGYNDTQSIRLISDFYYEFNRLHNEIVNDSFNTNNHSKLTIFLWDNLKFIDYINTIFSYDEYTLQQKLDKLMSTLKNHFVIYHHITQSIVTNSIELESLAKRRLRLSTLNLENVSCFF